MSLAQINALRRMRRGELEEVAERLGIPKPAAFLSRSWPTDDALRLAIIDEIVERELAAKAALDEDRR